MYNCSRCKNTFADEPALSNACGSFCGQCKADIHASSVESNKGRTKKLSGFCVWCGEKLTPNIVHASHEGDNVCKSCELRREWLLKAIRLSDRPSKYVARVEDRERPLREERENARKAIAETNKPKALESSGTTESEARLLRLEGMLDKLTKALGV